MIKLLFTQKISLIPEPTLRPSVLVSRCICCRQTSDTCCRSQRWIGSASNRGCHICDMVISRVFTGSSNVQNAAVASFPLLQTRFIRNEEGTSATKSDATATAIAAGKLGTAAAIFRSKPNSANALSIGPPISPWREAMTCPNEAYSAAVILSF